MTELTPAVYDAAHQLGFAMARAETAWRDAQFQITSAIADGAQSFTVEAEAERFALAAKTTQRRKVAVVGEGSH